MQLHRHRARFTQPLQKPQPPQKPPEPPKAPPKDDTHLVDTVETVALSCLGAGAGYYMGSRFALAMSPPMAPALGVISMVAGAATAYVLAVDLHSPIG